MRVGSRLFVHFHGFDASSLLRNLTDVDQERVAYAVREFFDKG
jgi:hypothetical protein